MSGETLIVNVMVLTEGQSLDDVSILIQDGVIEVVGEVPPEVAARAGRVIDGAGRIAVPGLVNAHMHSQSGTMAGFGDALSHPAFMWMTQAHTSRRSPDEIRIAVFLCAAQMLATGTTAAIDHFPGQRFSLTDMDAVLSAWEETGMRVALGMRFYDEAFDDILPAALPEDLASRARAVEILKPHPLEALREEMPDLVRRWHGRERRLSVFPAPSNPDRCSDASLLFCAELAEAHDLGIHTHLLETRAQARIAGERHGCSTVAHLEDLGVLSDRWSCAHAIWLTEDDIALLARHGAVVVHNPESNARLGAGRMRTPDMLAAGVRIGLGTDGSGANDNLVMQEAMRAACLLHRSDLADRSQWVTARNAFRMATLGGAQALRQDGRIGAIAPGYRADLALYRLDTPWWTPLNDPVAQLVYAETGSGVDLVMVDGRVLVEGGRVTAFDADGALREAGSMATSLAHRNADLFAVAGAIAELAP